MSICICKDTQKNIINKLLDIFTNEIAIQIEKSIETYTIQYISDNSVPDFLVQPIYNNKANDILSVVLTIESIINNINNNTIDISNIAFMCPDELNPQKFEKILQKLETEKINEKPKIGSTAFTCAKCKSKNSSIAQKQTRAGDEPPTTIVTCNVCSHVFKIS